MTALVVIWLVGTAAMAPTGFGLACASFLASTWRRLIAQFLVGAVVAVVGFVGNPVFNMLAFEPIVERLHTQMLADAKEAHCVGQSTEWLVARYGRPHQVAHVGTVDHWWYTPGPFFLVHDDYVGFTVENGIVTSAYLQVN